MLSSKFRRYRSLAVVLAAGLGPVALVSAQRGGGPGGGAGGPVADADRRRAAVRVRRTDERRPDLRGRRGQRQARRVLRWRRVRRRLEIRRRRQHLEADLRQRDVAGDRRAGRGAVQSQRRVGRHRRSLGRPRHGHDGRRHLQVDRRRRDLDEAWVCTESGRIGTIIIHPTNENIVMACVLGRATGPQKERGVYRTEDGGKTWQQTLFVDREHRLLRPAAVAEESERRHRRHVGDPVCRRTCSRAAVWAAASISRGTTAARSRRSRRPGCRNRRTARPTSRSRRPTATGCTR